MDAFTVLVVITLVHLNIALGLWIKSMVTKQLKVVIDKLIKVIEE